MHVNTRIRIMYIGVQLVGVKDFYFIKLVVSTTKKVGNR